MVVGARIVLPSGGSPGASGGDVTVPSASVPVTPEPSVDITPGPTEIPSPTPEATAVPSPTAAPTATPAPSSAQQTYTVKSGDTLGKIAKELLGNAGAYMAIFDANKDQLTDPNKIQPGQVLKIPAKH